MSSHSPEEGSSSEFMNISTPLSNPGPQCGQDHSSKRWEKEGLFSASIYWCTCGCCDGELYVQLVWPTEAQISGQMLFWVFLEETNMWIIRWSEADCPPQRGQALFNQLKAWIEKIVWGRKNSLSLPDSLPATSPAFSCLRTQTETLALLGSPACQPLDWSCTVSVQFADYRAWGWSVCIFAWAYSL